MEHELAKRMAESVARQGHIPRDKISIYQYGFELFISAICSILLVLVIGVAFGHPEFPFGFVPGDIMEELTWSVIWYLLQHLQCVLFFHQP